MDEPTFFNPYPGLRPFRSDEAHLFFGREGQSVELLRLLRQHRFVAVVGPSGSGKSSLVYAGLLPSLRAGFMRSAGSGWRIAALRPGANPIGNLSQALSHADVLGDGKLGERDRREFLEITLRRGSLGLAEAVTEARLPEGENLLVIVDQFEEIFRFQRVSADTEFRDDAAAFVKLLLGASSGAGGAYVLLTMRSDYLGDCAQFRDLPEAVNRGQYLIPRMTRDERRAAITGPAAVGGGTIAPRLVSRILNDVGSEPDQLPILQHALMRAWDWSERDGIDGNALDLQQYEAIGGAQDALSRHAEEAFGELDQRGQLVAEKVFRRLTERGPDNRDIRRPTRFGELCAIVHAAPETVVSVVDVFRRPGRSFLMPPADVALDSRVLVDISHESLIRGWNRLRDWVVEESEAARRYRRLAETATLWQAGSAGVLRDPELGHMLQWWHRDAPVAAWGRAYHPGFAVAAEFLERSRVEREAEQKRELAQTSSRRRRRRALFAALAAGLVVTSTLSVLAWQASTVARAEAERARRAETEALAARDSLADAIKAREAEATRARQAEEAALREAERAGRAEHAARLQLARAVTAEQGARLQLDRAINAERRTVNSELDGLSDLRSVLQTAQLDAGLASVPSLLSRSARTLSHLARHREAEQSYSNALRFNPQDPSALINRSDTYLNLGEPEKARADLEVLLELDPNSWLARLNMAVTQMLLGDYDAAARHFRTAIDVTQYGASEAGQPEIAPEIRQATRYRMLTLDPEEVPAALRLGLVSTLALKGDLQKGDGPSFVRAFRADRAQDWSMNAVLNSLNWLWLARKGQTGQEWSAVESYGVFAAEGALWERAGWSKDTQGSGEFGEAAVRSYCRFRQIHATRREERYRGLANWVSSRLAALRPNGCPGLNLSPVPMMAGVEDRTLAARETKDQERADQLYTEALQYASSSERPYLLLTRGWHRRSRGVSLQSLVRKEQPRADQDRLWNEARRYFAQAAADAEAALKIQPRLVNAFFLRGRAKYDAARNEDLQEKEKVADIIGDLDIALAYSPTNTSALFTRAWTLQYIYPREAAVSLRKALALDPDSAEFWAKLAILEMRNGDYLAAQDAASVALRLDPDSIPNHKIAEAASLRLPHNEIQTGDVSLRVGWKFLEKGEASQVLGELLRAERFFGAALIELAEASVRGSPGLDQAMFQAARQFRCVYKVAGADKDQRRILKNPVNDLNKLSDPGWDKVLAVLKEVDTKFDPTACTSSFRQTMSSLHR
jgi:tetratricopeptide (TPR) repeat protein/energy-coupling factor transporter ATP-binding protein EcfA2